MENAGTNRGYRRGDNIAERLGDLGAMAVKIACALPKNPAYKHMALQLVRSGTSGGANYEEARGAESRADFIHKLCIACKEVRETLYWLRLARGAGVAPKDLAERALDEADQLVAILTASILTARRNAD